MFGMKKHNFTCPDVIFLLDRQKKINRATIAVNLLFVGGLIAVGKIAEMREEKKYDTKTETPETPYVVAE